jgi:EAL domain-containing protein (putative c-di-GMP-specific phosphodiesterase class I)/GGDEF domain-containing protein
MLNRPAVFAAVSRALSEAGSAAVLRVRVARLREYQVMFGYQAAEALVESFQLVLRACLREQDAMVAVGEGDVVVVLPGLAESSRVELAAAKISRAFVDPLMVAGRPARVFVAVGASTGEQGCDVEDLCLGAYAACEQARRSPERYVLVQERPKRTFGYDDLHDAISANQLELYLQPIFSLATGQLRKFEALSRWQHPRWGSIPPERFVAMAEQTGLIEAMTRWNLNATLRMCAPYLRRDQELKCAVNLSPIALTDAFPEQVAGALRMWGVAASSLVLEITETAFVNNPVALTRKLAQLHDIGLEVAIDDFGSGYSSLTYLRDFPVDELKIDMSFVRDMLGNEGRNERLVASMVDMAHCLEVRVVAEGIENSAVWTRLQEMGCDCGQGYYPGRPAPAAEALHRYAGD